MSFLIDSTFVKLLFTSHTDLYIWRLDIERKWSLHFKNVPTKVDFTDIYKRSGMACNEVKHVNILRVNGPVCCWSCAAEEEEIHNKNNIKWPSWEFTDGKTLVNSRWVNSSGRKIGWGFTWKKKVIQSFILFIITKDLWSLSEADWALLYACT